MVVRVEPRSLYICWKVDRGLLDIFFFSSRRRHTSVTCDWSSDVCSSELDRLPDHAPAERRADSRTSRSCSISTQAPVAPCGGGFVPAISDATSSAAPVNTFTAGPISAKLEGRRLTAQPPTNTWWAVFNEWRTDLRDFASASPVMQHVLMTCSSASAS